MSRHPRPMPTGRFRDEPQTLHRLTIIALQVSPGFGFRVHLRLIIPSRIQDPKHYNSVRQFRARKNFIYIYIYICPYACRHACSTVFLPACMPAYTLAHFLGCLSIGLPTYTYVRNSELSVLGAQPRIAPHHDTPNHPGLRP